MADLLEKQVGEYRLIRFLGNGNFGVVYEGVHIHLETHVAVKLLKGSFTEVEIKEFLDEARILARLEHPNIVRIFTFSVAMLDEQKLPFLAMSLAPNGTLLKRHPRGSPLSLLTIITYVKQIASALQYAHQNKYIHRDVKPENILLGKNDELLLSDFGIAVIAHSTRSQETQKPIGSWAYAAPEQFIGKAVRASDQYSLAAVVYEWLCGERPFQGDFTQLAVQHHLNIPPPPLHEKMNISPAVEQVVMKALEKDPKNRFPTIEAFAEALEQAATASHPAPHPFPPILPSPKFLFTYGGHVRGAGVVAWSPDGSRIASSATDLHSSRFDRDNIVQVWNAATGAGLLSYKGHANQVLALAWSPDSQRIASGSSDSTVQVWEAATGKQLLSYKGHANQVRALAWSPDGGRLASCSKDNTVQVWEAATGKQLLSYKGHTDQVLALAWSPDGQHIASGSFDSTVQVWEAATGKQLQGYSTTGPVFTIAWSPDGKRIANVWRDGTDNQNHYCFIEVWEAATGKQLQISKKEFRRDIAAWSPDGTRIAFPSSFSFGSYEPTVQVCDTATGKKLLTYEGHKDDVLAQAWSPDGRRIVSGSRKETLVWDTSNRKTLLLYQGHLASVSGIAWSPNGRRIASRSEEDHTVQVWDAASGKQLLISSDSGFMDLGLSAEIWSPDGARLALHFDNTVKVWDAMTGTQLQSHKVHSGRVRHIAWSPDGTRLAIPYDSLKKYTDYTEVWEAATGKRILTCKGYVGGWSPDGSRLASHSDNTVQVWDAMTGTQLLSYNGHSDRVRYIAWSPDGSRLASCSEDNAMQVWEAATGKQLLSYNGSPLADKILHLPHIAWSPDGTHLAASSFFEEKTVQVWDAASGKQLLSCNGSRAIWSPDGSRLAFHSGNTMQVWDATTGTQLLSYSGSEGIWSPDGTRLALHFDNTVQVWDAASGKQLLSYNGHADKIYHKVWSPDSRRIASSSWDRTVQIWEAATGKNLIRLSTNPQTAMAWSPDGTSFALANHGVHIWQVA